MPEIPEPDWIALAEAHSRVLAHFDGAPPDNVKQALVNAFWDGKIQTQGRCKTWFSHNQRVTLGKYVWDPDQVRISWESNGFARFSNGTVHVFHNVYVRVIDLVRWLGVQRQEVAGSTVNAEHVLLKHPASRKESTGAQECGDSGVRSASEPTATQSRGLDGDEQRSPKRGPKPGTVDRYATADRQLYPEYKSLLNPADAETPPMSRTGASLHLAQLGKIKGGGTEESRAKRLRDRYAKDHPNQ